MASLFTHALTGGTIAYLAAGTQRQLSRWFVVAAAVAAVLPDADAIGYRLGVEYGSFWGHRGFTHSIVFALLFGLLVSAAIPPGKWGTRRRTIFLVMFLAVLSHALLDMLTDGGMGVGLYLPFSPERIFFPWRPVEVSPIGIRRFFSEWGVRVLKSEMIVVWIPCLLLIGGMFLRRRAGGSGKNLTDSRSL